MQYRLTAVLGWLMAAGLVGGGVPSGQAAASTGAQRCAQLASAQRAPAWPMADTRIESVHWVEAGPLANGAGSGAPGRGGAAAPVLPAHCELIGRLQDRDGQFGQHYAIRFHLRMPEAWNGRFLFQGGGGSNGELGDALGRNAPYGPPALLQGFAVVSQDSGHDNRNNLDPAHAGILAFGFDPQARSNYGHASLPLVTDAAKAAVRAFYGDAPAHSYFVGCSKGGAEAMAVAQRYADRFDGIVAGAPGFALPRAALAEAWDTQQFAKVAPRSADGRLAIASLGAAFSDADFALVRASVLAACDSLDGAADGLVSDLRGCTTRRVLPQLRQRTCRNGSQTACLAPARVAALLEVMRGPHDRRGKALYRDWAWDPAIANAGWRGWKVGSTDGRVPARNVVLGASSLASVFTVPPTALPSDPQALLDWQLAFDFDRDAGRIDARGGGFEHSAWEDISARSPDLDALRAHKGRLLVWHGVADPVFSVRDTTAWWDEVHARYRGAESGFVRFFPVPGLNHCGGGEGTDEFDVLAAIVAWVEQGQAPSQLPARAGASMPWPGRERALCAWPAQSRHDGRGSVEKAASFRCE